MKHSKLQHQIMYILRAITKVKKIYKNKCKLLISKDHAKFVHLKFYYLSANNSNLLFIH